MSTSALMGGVFSLSSNSGSPVTESVLEGLFPSGGSPATEGEVNLLHPTGGSPVTVRPAPVPLTYDLAVATGVAFAQVLAVTKTLNVAVATGVVFQDTSTDPTTFESPVTSIVFSQIIGAVREINVSVSNLITFANKTQRTYVENVSTGVAFSASGQRGPQNTDNLITFTQQVIADLSKTVSNTVTFDSSVATTKILNINIANTIMFANFAAAINMASCDRSRFASNCLPGVVFTPRSTILLVCDVDSIELRNPELGNSETIDPKRALNITRYGKLTLYRNPIWPKKTTLEFDLTAITKAKALELQDFLVNCLGKEITLTDHESRVWLGVITNPDTLISELSDDDCNYSSSLVFVGEPQ